MGEVILAAEGHSDDAVWGCGGSLQKEKAKGNKVYMITMAGLYISKDMTEQQKENEHIRIEEWKKSAEIIGVDDVFAANLPDGKMTGLRYEATDLRKLINKLGVTTMYIPFEFDDHGDHVATAKLARVSYDIVSKVLVYPGPRNAKHPNSFPLMPPVLVQISKEQLDKKIAAYSVYGSQQKKGSLFNMIEDLNGAWGCLLAHGKPGIEGKIYAEGFILEKLEEYI